MYPLGENQSTGSIHRGQQIVKNFRADKRAYLDSLAVEAEEAPYHGNVRAVYAITKKNSVEYLTNRRDP